MKVLITALAISTLSACGGGSVEESTSSSSTTTTTQESATGANTAGTAPLTGTPGVAQAPAGTRPDTSQLPPALPNQDPNRPVGNGKPREQPKKEHKTVEIDR